MEHLESIVSRLSYFVWDFGIPAGADVVPFVVIALLGTGLFLTVRLRLVQVRRLGHGFAVASGKYDDPVEPGDVPHYQALTTALSATVGIGNIAGVAIAIHWGGPGALFWMWITALLGMAVKFSEVTLAQHYREVHAGDSRFGTVSGGPMYYIEKGLGPRWRWMAVLFAGLLGFTAFFTGNAIQANTVADALGTSFGVPAWVTGLVTAGLVAAVILGGIARIGRVTSVLAPAMAIIYVLGAMYIIAVNYAQVLPSLGLILREAFAPSAGVAGTGAGAFVLTMMWGVRRGLFSNEAGQGSAPIAHAAAKTGEPVSEGVVALLEPFIDTLVICTMTGLVIITTGVWKDRVPTELTLGGGDLSYVVADGRGVEARTSPPEELRVREGVPVAGAGVPRLAWHEVAIESFYTDPQHVRPFTGVILPLQGRARAEDGTEYASLYADAVESAGPLTMLAFERGLPGTWGRFLVVLSILLFAISTAISWSYYGDRCAYYLFGARAILPYKVLFVLMHFTGAVLTLHVVWTMGDVALGAVILPNLVALVLLSGKVARLTRSYFERRPWIQNAEAHRRAVEARCIKRPRPLPR